MVIPSRASASNYFLIAAAVCPSIKRKVPSILPDLLPLQTLYIRSPTYYYLPDINDIHNLAFMKYSEWPFNRMITFKMAEITNNKITLILFTHLM